MRPDIVAEARLWLGTPYVHQASIRGVGTDCLGLIRGVWRAVLGPEPEAMPAYTPDWGELGQDELLIAGAARMLQHADREAVGNVIVFRMRAHAVAKHLGIQTEVGESPGFIHAYDRHGVVESPLTAPWRAKIVGRFRFPTI